MTIVKQIAKHLKELYFGKNWTGYSLNQALQGVDYKMAITKFNDLNTIIALVYHINYYCDIATKVIEGGPLVGSDKESFNHPNVTNEAEWQAFLENKNKSIRNLITLIEVMDDALLLKNFDDGKYGNYYRNIQGLIEHGHYHLGQIVLIKKMILAQQNL